MVQELVLEIPFGIFVNFCGSCILLQVADAGYYKHVLYPSNSFLHLPRSPIHFVVSLSWRPKGLPLHHVHPTIIYENKILCQLGETGYSAF